MFVASMEKELKEQLDEEKKATIQKEVNDLKGLIPEVQVKIDDSRESAKNAALVSVFFYQCVFSFIMEFTTNH